MGNGIHLSALEEKAIVGVMVLRTKHHNRTELYDIALLPNKYLISRSQSDNFPCKQLMGSESALRNDIIAAIILYFEGDSSKSNWSLENDDFYITLTNFRKTLMCSATIVGFKFPIPIIDLDGTPYVNIREKGISKDEKKKYLDQLIQEFRKKKAELIHNKYEIESVNIKALNEIGKYSAILSLKDGYEQQYILRYCGKNNLSINLLVNDSEIPSIQNDLMEFLKWYFIHNVPDYNERIYKSTKNTESNLVREANAPGEKSGNCENCTNCCKCVKVPLLYYRDNQVLREHYLIQKEDTENIWYIDKWRQRKTEHLNDLGHISPLQLDILSWISKLRYIQKAALIDIVRAGIINDNSDVQFNTALENMCSYGLIDELKFVSIQNNSIIAKNDNRVQLNGRPPNSSIYTLGEAGAKLLRDIGREGQYNPFDRFQDGNVVKAKLAANQWLIYWLYAYRDKFSRQYYTSRKIYVRDVEQSGVRIHAAVKCDNTFIVGEPVRRTANDLKKQFQDELLDKFDRFMIVFDDAKQDDIFSSYDKVFLPEKKIICYICEDLNHVDEVYYMLQSKREKYPNQEIWFTTDLKTHNYNEEGQRFIVFNDEGKPGFVDLNKRFDLGEERSDWEKKEINTAPEASNIKK